jgi:hypothetical protein
VWVQRVDEDASGLTFEEWDPSADTDASEAPVAMIVNSSELRAAGFDLREVIPLQLETAGRGGQRTRGAALKQIHDMGTRRYVLSVDNDNESGHDVSEYELGASGLPRVYVSPQQPCKNWLKILRKIMIFVKKKKWCGAMTPRRIG